MKSLLLLCSVLALIACSEIGIRQPSQPLQAARDYERLLVGNLQADYVGDDNCLARCHAHDRIHSDFQASVHGAQVIAETGLPLVNCESCHGPGSLAIVDVETRGRCNTGELLPLHKFPAPAQSLLCLKCHGAISPPAMRDWNASPHARSDVSCFDCHQLHRGPAQKVSRRETAELCYGCHRKVSGDTKPMSRHPVLTGDVICTDCHDPHGSSRAHLLIDEISRDFCSRPG